MLPSAKLSSADNPYIAQLSLCSAKPRSKTSQVPLPLARAELSHSIFSSHVRSSATFEVPMCFSDLPETFDVIFSLTGRGIDKVRIVTLSMIGDADRCWQREKILSGLSKICELMFNDANSLYTVEIAFTERVFILSKSITE